MQTLRFASDRVALHYPLATSGTTTWSPCSGGWSSTVTLPDIPNDHIVVPSFAQLGVANTDFSVELASDQATWRLDPTAPTAPDVPTTDARVTTHIDYFHCRADLHAPTVTVSVASVQPPQDYLLCISSRAFRHSPGPGCRNSARIAVPAVSQLSAPRSLRHRICSPTSLAMLLHFHGIETPLSDVVRGTLHAPSGLFGVWPLAVRTAADAGLVAAVECFTEIDEAVPIIDRGLPIVASIRFAAGALRGAALAATAGHLVVVTGFDQNWAYINDPAAKDASAVPRQCPRAEFASAWLAERGAAYIMSPT